MKKIVFDKKRIEDSWNSGKEKVNEELAHIKSKNYGNTKAYFFAFVVIVLIVLGFYFHVIQNVFYSLLSIIGILIVLGIGVGWEYLVFTYMNKTSASVKKYAGNSNWEKLEWEFEHYITESKYRIDQLNKYSIIHYMAAIGLLILSCAVMFADWIYGNNFSQLPYSQDINPSVLLAVVLVVFSILFMVLYYLNQMNVKKYQEELSSAQKYILNLKSAYLLGKENLIDSIIADKINPTNKQISNSESNN
ncbi:hypothetical protein O2K51_03240 [Apibacter raozihei]|uniref:hypothetical protein n=1 Tax=Apibacter raozihei TaxID=2500547 RepID=UPI000FE4434B|nr:hypothetical protein [Apibacter raozihei]